MSDELGLAHPLAVAACALNARLEMLRFGEPISHVYNPLVYAARNHLEYVQRFGHPGKKAVLLGMNPGPFGMAQTGIPFGDVQTVGEWLQIDYPVQKPLIEHPKRPVRGISCPRVEVSGQRLWGMIRARFGVPERFFASFFVANYCPLCFIEHSGRNRTPDKLPAAERAELFDACDAHLQALVDYLGPDVVIGIGGFAERRAADALRGRGVTVARVLHPSPASPVANRGWARQAEMQLIEIVGDSWPGRLARSR